MSNHNYYHVYATANNNNHYYRDIQNILRIYNTASGVPKVMFCIAISQVKPINYIDKLFVWLVKRLFKNHPTIDLEEVIFKSNIGRDFSSYALMIERIKKQANDIDYVFFQNRSGFGPFKTNWYKDFIAQFRKFPNTAICGSTINFNDHPLRSSSNNLPHVQTYAFVTTLAHLKLLGESFPGTYETSRLDIIYKGEIELSTMFLNLELGLTCMEWPDHYITRKTRAVSAQDVRGRVKQSHQFYHKGYILNNEKKSFRNLVYLKTLCVFLLNCIIKRKSRGLQVSI